MRTTILPRLPKVRVGLKELCIVSAMAVVVAEKGLVLAAVLLLLWLCPDALAVRRHLSEIRYHFTTCGKTGRMGPSYQDCVDYYTLVGSPIIRDNVLTDTFSTVFIGSQSFRPPRITAYNLTIAGAAGGRGICNSEYGKGLVQNHQFTPFNDSFQYLILVGQRGIGPCSSGEADPGYILCGNLPRDLKESTNCTTAYIEWISVLDTEVQERTLNFSGGGGGGGASFFGYRDTRVFLDIRVFGVSSGGGGSSALLDFSVLRNLLSELENSTFNDSTLYDDIINANSSTYSEIFESDEGYRGYRVKSEFVTAGAGGGIADSIEFPSNQQDGRALGKVEDFSLGGTHCASNDFSLIPRQLREGDGGFGGGGGGCGGGGGGGGLTGGAVLGETNIVPGSGGYAFRSNTSTPSMFRLNTEEDGYVDVVPADCGCVYECVVYEEEDQFECLCPNETQPAPNLNDCYYTDTQGVDDTQWFLMFDNGYQFKRLKTGNTTHLYGMSTVLKVEKENISCAILFLGEDRRDMVLVSEPTRGGGKVTKLSKIHLNFTDGSYSMSEFFTILDEPQIVTGGVLISNGYCTLEENVMVVEFSRRDPSVPYITAAQYEDYIALQGLVIDNPETTALYMQLALNLSNQATTADQRKTGLSRFQLIGVCTVAALVASILVCGALCCCCCCCCCCRKDKKMHWNPKHNANSPLLAPAKTSSMMTNAGYVHYSFRNPQSHAIQVEIDGTQSKNSFLSSANEYEVLSFEGSTNSSKSVAVASSSNSLLPPTTLRAEMVKSSQQISSKFGHSAPAHNFAEYHRSRANSNVRSWQIPRTSLAYMRELGEGQFGKVILMKAQGIGGYRESIAVAVKTLNSRDTAVTHKFMEEAELMKKFSHPNIVSILGVCTDDADENSAPLIILEYMPYGDLQSFMQTYRPTEENPVSIITHTHFYSFAIDVARALEFLATSKFVHRDIAARNCLVGAELFVKIADFGLARGVNENSYYRVAGKQMLPVRTMSPESLLFGVFTTAGDVWSYGVLLWEIVTYGSMPLAGMNIDMVVEEAQNKTLKHIVPPDCPPVLSSLITQCHNHNPDERPTFSNILSQLGCVQH